MKIQTICSYLNELLSVETIRDFPGAYNGLQIDNECSVSKIGGAVDANSESLRMAIEHEIDFLIVHHGFLFYGTQALQGAYRKFIKDCLDHQVALYGVHLPLDIHPELSHNASIAQKLHLKTIGHFAPFENQMAGLVTTAQLNRERLKQALHGLFPKGFHAIEFGPEQPQKIGLVSGSGGQSLLETCVKDNIDTLITGEVRHSAFSFAQLYRLNIYACGHYETEVFGIQNVLKKLSQTFELPCEFLDVPSGL